ncbi:golgin subfamily A member 2-like isoform X4 [Dreissena polymorpha]|uniref:golgin subfamily A member 2-like isoform X3 n=1 Tax=Dreissena polymorpha TaxID=45954 RepID=UPI0022652478|nr:golgin subfamily A member 2-like isoform X3 [Dreissena polymorpha]XP_052230051.1 golgin subfamily A member 2-like isoform X4 [Dreissena polymorpha]
MADNAKKEKIAAARKKLKQFQKINKGKQPNDHNTDSVGIAKNNNNGSVIETEKPVTLDFKQSKADYKMEKHKMDAGKNSEHVEEEITKDFMADQNHSHSVAVFEEYINRAAACTPTASTESLQQLSRQINGILAESPVGFEVKSGGHDDVMELESRNKELAALLAQHVQANEQLTAQNEQIRQHAVELQFQVERERSDHQQRFSQELGPIKEQLQVHIQTIGILVAEKTELQSQLAQALKISDQRLEEVEDLTSRLKTSKSRITDLERTLANSNLCSQKLEQSSKESAKEIDKLRLDVFKLNKSHEELKQNISEVQEKLKSKTSECSGVQASLAEVSKRLELAELYRQQLSSETDSGTRLVATVSQLQQECDSLTVQLNKCSEAMQQMTVERDQLSDQYTHYLNQFNEQIAQLTVQVTSLTQEREHLVTQNHDMEASMIELQRKLEEVNSATGGVEETSHSEILQELQSLQGEHADLMARHEAQIRDNAQLSKLLEEREDAVERLESRLEEVGDLAGDRAQLLENIQSDKTALSRALTQNRDLKQQLAELQNGFVKMSNDNMELLDRLQTEQHVSRDLQTRLNTQEDEMTALRMELSSQRKALELARENSVEANKVRLLHEQIQDRLRHYEAQAQLVETLQKELHSSQDMVDALTTQNSQLRTMLIKATETKKLNPDTDVQNAQRDDVITSLQKTIGHLETERGQLLESLSTERDLADRLGVRLADLQEEVIHNNASKLEKDQVSRHEYDKLRQAMDQIQEKYNHVMRDKADLCDKAEELEHMVLQLQGETETIGEYISLYHHQRALLQQREIQKNEYIKQLAHDREELQDKLGELQTLVITVRCVVTGQAG